MSKKVDLTVLKRMVSELESTLQKAESLSTITTSDGKLDWMVEMNKATGLATGVSIEATMLIGDIQHLVAGSPGDANKGDFIRQLLGGLKGPGAN